MTELGEKLGPYEILNRLGGGGMGVVFRAWDERLHREVAIKLLHGDYTMPGMRERFLQEARAVSGLNHPNICTVFDIGEQGGDPYLVMELLEGETLKEKISRGALAADEIITYGQEIAEALGIAHAKGIVHRDIKPANIFLVGKTNGKCQAKVLDFGLAKIDMAELGGWGSRSLDLTVAGSTVGTLAYMSPEQARGLALDGRSDLFSLGVVLYEMATRRAPFQGTTSALIFVQLLERAPDAIRNWNDSIPKDLERIILRLLAKDRKERFQTAKELQDALAKIAGRVARGGWLKKGAAVVPLVRVAEPIARAKRPLRIPSGAQRAMEVDSKPAKVEAGSATKLIHAGDRDEAAVQKSGDAPGMVPPIPGKEADALGVEVWNDSSEEIVFAAPGAQKVKLGRSSSGVTQFEHSEHVDTAIGVKATEEAVPELQWWKLGGGARSTVVVVLLVASIGGALWLVRSGRLRPAVLGPADRLLLTRVQNRTNDKSLDGSVLEGLNIELRQSPFLNLKGNDAYYAGLRQIENERGDATTGSSSRRVAHGVRAKAYLYGEIKREGAAYVIGVDVLNTESNDKLAHVVEVAPTRAQIPAAIGRVATALRAEMGEDANSIAGTNVPLELEATEDLDALHDYAVAEAAMQQGKTSDALIGYRQAIARDPKFTQAQMKLAWLYQTEKAEVDSADASQAAVESAKRADEKLRLLAQFCYEMNASGNYGRAAATIRQYADRYPRDVEGMIGLARMHRVQGHFVETLLAAQQAYGDDPYETVAYAEAEEAMIGMNRFDGVLQLEAQARRLGVRSSGKILAAAYLAGRRDLLATEIDSIQVDRQLGQGSYAALVDEALYLDNAGKISAGNALWRTVAYAVAGAPELLSARAYMLAQGALDRAMTGDCAAATALAKEATALPLGRTGRFHAGLAFALCGEQVEVENAVVGLRQSFPQSTVVVEAYVPMLQAAQALAKKAPAETVELLAGEMPSAQLSTASYLMGLAHLAARDDSLAASNFETVLRDRGRAFAAGNMAYPMAQIGIARIWAKAGDRDKSGAAYQRFAVLWKDADPRHPLTFEASRR